MGDEVQTYSEVIPLRVLPARLRKSNFTLEVLGYYSG